MTEARQSLLRQVVPVVGVTLALGVIALLAMGVTRARRAERDARMMAEQIVPSQRVLQQLDRAIAELALVAAMPHTVARISAARDQLEAAIASYQPFESLDGHWKEARRRVAELERLLVDHAQAGPASSEEAMNAAFDGVRAQSAIGVEQAMRDLRELASAERTAMFAELGLLLFVGGACIYALVRAAWREQHAFDQDTAIIRRLEHTNADLEAFAGRIAHDLRGPLSPILAGSQLIESAPVSLEVRRVAERIERSARKLFGMIDALLTFTRLSGEPEADASALLVPLIEEALAGFADRAALLGATFDVRVDDPGEVRCEPEIAASMLQNLLENALKYGLDGSPDRVIEVRAFSAGGWAVIEIEDHGPGVSPRIGDRVFEPLVQASSSRGGVGLGLATVRRLVEARGGQVELRPGQGRGALFRVTLPRPQPSGAVHARPGS